MMHFADTSRCCWITLLRMTQPILGDTSIEGSVRTVPDVRPPAGLNNQISCPCKCRLPNAIGTRWFASPAHVDGLRRGMKLRSPTAPIPVSLTILVRLLRVTRQQANGRRDQTVLPFRTPPTYHFPSAGDSRSIHVNTQYTGYEWAWRLPAKKFTPGCTADTGLPLRFLLYPLTQRRRQWLPLQMRLVFADAWFQFDYCLPDHSRSLIIKVISLCTSVECHYVADLPVPVTDVPWGPYIGAYYLPLSGS